MDLEEKNLIISPAALIGRAGILNTHGLEESYKELTEKDSNDEYECI